MSRACYGLEGKAVLITGGSRGIGLSLARAFLDEGARVAICARKEAGLAAAAEALDAGDRLLAVPAHVSQDAAVDALFARIHETFGRLDILVNNVGMNLMSGGVADTEPAAFRKIIDSNLIGAFLVSRAAARMMREQGGGRIVSVSSIAARKASPGMGTYGVAKAGLEMLTRVLAAELAWFNIQVNAVAPGMVKTDFSKPFWSNTEIHEQLVKAIPMGRLAETVDIVPPVLFLASPGAAYITGQVLVVDGGASVI